MFRLCMIWKSAINLNNFSSFFCSFVWNSVVTYKVNPGSLYIHCKLILWPKIYRYLPKIQSFFVFTNPSFYLTSTWFNCLNVVRLRWSEPCRSLKHWSGEIEEVPWAWRSELPFTFLPLYTDRWSEGRRQYELSLSFSSVLVLRKSLISPHTFASAFLLFSSYFLFKFGRIFYCKET